MRNFVIRLFVNALALSAAAWMIDGIQVSGDAVDLLLVALIFGLLNAILKPLLMFLSLPFLLITLGLFAFVVNGVMLMLTAGLTEHLSVSGIWAAIFGSVVISLVTLVLGRVLDDGAEER